MLRHEVARLIAARLAVDVPGMDLHAALVAGRDAVAQRVEAVLHLGRHRTELGPKPRLLAVEDEDVDVVYARPLRLVEHPIRRGLVNHVLWVHPQAVDRPAWD